MYRESFQKVKRVTVYASLRVKYRKWAADAAVGRKGANQRCAAEAVRIFKQSEEKYGKISLRQAVREDPPRVPRPLGQQLDRAVAAR